MDDLSTTLFRDSQLKNGSKLILKEPTKVKKDDDGMEIEESEEEDAEGGEDEMMEEGGEDEIYEMAEDGEAEMNEGDEQDPKDDNESPDAEAAVAPGDDQAEAPKASDVAEESKAGDQAMVDTPAANNLISNEAGAAASIDNNALANN